MALGDEDPPLLAPPPTTDGSGANLSRSVEKALDEAAATGILNLSNRKLRDFPRAAGNHDLSDVTRADLSKNRLSEVPDEVCQFISLEVLNLYHNCVRTIPASIGNLQSLTYLNVSRSHLCALPAYLCCLPLKVLIVSNNKLTSLPKDIGCFPQLRELDVSCNEIQRLPPQIGNLESLRELNVRRNQLDCLPEEISELPLVRLDFSCNKITRIPVCYRHLRHLQNILLDNNPLQSPPAQVCTKGKIHIFKYLNIEACRAVPDLTDFHQVIHPQGFSSCFSSDSCPSRGLNGLDSGFNSVDSGSKRWSGNESADEFTDLSLRMMELSQEQRQLRDSQQPRRTENGGTGEADFEQIDFIDSSVNEDNEVAAPEPPGSRHHHNPPQDQRRERSSSSPDKGGLLRDGEGKRRPDTLQIWQERERQSQNQAGERRERGTSISFTCSRPAPCPGGCSENNSGPRSPRKIQAPTLVDLWCLSQTDGQLHNEASGATTVTPTPRADRASLPNLDTASPGTPTTVHKPHSFLFHSTTRSNLKSSSIVSPVSPRSHTFLEPAVDAKSAEQKAREEEQLAQLRKSIEWRLKRSLPEDLGEALNNGVMLCQLVNHLRPRTITIIHTPSPAVPQLSLAKCRRNVESFLEACRKLGVPQLDLCLPSDILLGRVCRLHRTVQEVLKRAEQDSGCLAHHFAGFATFYVCVMSLLYLVYCNVPVF